MENEALKALNEQIATLKDLIKVQSELITELRNRPAASTTIVHQYHYNPSFGYGYWHLGQWVPYYSNSPNYGGAGSGIGGTYGAQGNAGAAFTTADVQVSNASNDGIMQSRNLLLSVAK